LSGSASSSQEVLDVVDRRDSSNEVPDDGKNTKKKSCNPCSKHSKDCATDTYDLTSPCCDPRCVSNGSTKRKPKKSKSKEDVLQNNSSSKPPKPPKKESKGISIENFDI